ncbi:MULTISPECIES: hypothetical protein [unclassified Corynebacterium]|uniref:hypothetical protein n=1 Tax=unclassified Corynebacterium TaxID=2624378 RepID=UPI002167E7DA|nr:MULTISPECIES: hypothetical protein [unclassified Corynebacterium]MCS4489943.1 hypothetical protein [Corynebacterium sp. ES2775-CONJ]MCS4531799.1 hypothetical protein [Corynebacterium sp. ES2730-CONJ]
MRTSLQRLGICGYLTVFLSVSACSTPQPDPPELPLKVLSSLDSTIPLVRPVAKDPLDRLINQVDSGFHPQQNKPGYIDCLGPALIQPRSIKLSCTSSNSITSITWTRWAKDTAIGSGNLRDGSSVSIVLSDPIDTQQGWAFSQVFVDDIALLFYQLTG